MKEAPFYGNLRLGVSRCEGPRLEAIFQLRTTYTYPVKGPTVDAGKFLHLSVLSNFTF
jgi:hypothetical protein